MTPPRALLLFAHGSSLACWREPFDDILAKLHKKFPNTPLSLGFLERTQPDFQGAVRHLLRQVDTASSLDITVVPLFLAKSVHTERDINACISAALDAHPHLIFTVAEPMLADAALRDWLVDSLGRHWLEV
jgi:sirohydrochlorin ferrochelatase